MGPRTRVRCLFDVWLLRCSQFKEASTYVGCTSRALPISKCCTNASTTMHIIMQRKNTHLNHRGREHHSILTVDTTIHLAPKHILITMGTATVTTITVPTTTTSTLRNPPSPPLPPSCLTQGRWTRHHACMPSPVPRAHRLLPIH